MKKCLIGNCTGKESCLEHCPCDCHKIKNPWEMTLQELTDAWGEEILPDDITDSLRMYYLWDALAKDIEKIKKHLKINGDE